MTVKINFLRIALVVFILLGIFLRFYKIDSEYLWNDESVFIISALKFHHQSYEDGSLYVLGYPPLGKWILGLVSVFGKFDDVLLKILTTDMFALKHIPISLIDKYYLPMRILVATLGALSVFIIYLITKQTFGVDSALWSTTIMSLSVTQILFSRHAFLDIIMVFLFLCTFFFYLKYVNSMILKQKYLYLALTMISFIFALGSKHYQPLLLIPLLIFLQFLLKRGQLKENVIFTSLVLLSTYSFFKVLYPAEALQGAGALYSSESTIATLVGFSLPKVIYYNLQQNSYLFLLSASLLIIFSLYKLHNLKTFSAIKNYFNGLSLNAKAISIFLILSLGFFSFTEVASRTSKYSGVILIIPLAMLGGAVINKTVSRYKWLSYLCLVLLALTFVKIAPDFPYSMWEYANFGKGDFYPHSYAEELNDVAEELAKLGNRPLLSNDINTLIFYDGPKAPMIVPFESGRCSDNYIQRLPANTNILIISPQAMDDPFVCPKLKELNLRQAKSWDKNTLLTLFA